MPEFIPRPNLPEGLAGILAQLRAAEPNPLAILMEQLGKVGQAGFQGAAERKKQGDTIAEQKRREGVASEQTARKSYGDIVGRLAELGSLGNEVPGVPPFSLPKSSGLPSLGALSQGGPAQMTPMTKPATLHDIQMALGLPPSGPNRAISVQPKGRQESELDRALKAARLEATKTGTEERKRKGEADKQSKEIERLLRARSQVASQLKDRALGDAERSVLGDKMRQIESSIQKAGLPGFDSTMEGNIRKARAAVESGRISPEEAQKWLAAKHPGIGEVFQADKGAFSRIAGMFR